MIVIIILFNFFLGCPWFEKNATLDWQSSYLYSTNSQQVLPQDALYFKA